MLSVSILPRFTGAFSFPSQLSGATHVLSSPGWPLCGHTRSGPRVCMPLHLCRRLHSYTFTLLRSCSLALSALTHLNATLTNDLTSVDSKQVTVNLNPSESALTKNMGGGGCYG